MFDVIMVPVDGSEYSFKAVDVAVEMAQKFSSKIAAVHVLEEFSFNSYDSEEDSGDALLANVTKKANDAGVEVVEHLLTADPLRDMNFISLKGSAVSRCSTVSTPTSFAFFVTFARMASPVSSSES